MTVGIDCSTSPYSLRVERSSTSPDEITDPELAAAWADVGRNVVDPVKAWCDVWPVTREIAQAARDEINRGLDLGLWSWRDREQVMTLMSLDLA